jgi:hypothetical protein
MSRHYDNRPSLLEIKYENGEIEEDDGWRYEPVDCGDYYMIEYYKYANDFPKEWALSHLPGTGPEQCGNCYDYGSKDGVFLGYCLNCAKYDYNGERGPGMDLYEPAIEDLSPPPVEPNLTRMAKIIAQLRECSDDLDYVFQIAEGKVSSDDQRALDYFGIEKE